MEFAKPLWSDVDSLHWDTVEKMYHAGMITRREDDLGDILISLKSEAIKWTSVTGLERPEMANDTSARGMKPWHRPKLQLAGELIKQGFERGAPAILWKAELVAAPPRGYVVMEFKTDFENKTGASEKVTIEHEATGWKVVGYVID